jgi:hypothetical protein
VYWNNPRALLVGLTMLRPSEDSCIAIWTGQFHRLFAKPGRAPKGDDPFHYGALIHPK